MGIEFPWWFVFVIIGYSAQWWAGAALLTATLPRGRIGWLRRLALATLGVIITYAVTTVGFWIHAEVFRGGWRGQLAWQRALVVLNAIAESLPFG